MTDKRTRTFAVSALAIVHGLGVLGAPFAAMIHFGQVDATAHQNFHVVWEAFKYFSASLVCVAIAIGPAIDHWSHGSFLIISIIALAVLAWSPVKAEK